MAITSHFSRSSGKRAASQALAHAGLAYAWSGFVIMWLFWVSFVIFLAQPSRIQDWWPLPTVDRPGFSEGGFDAIVANALLIACFGLQHSLMARPWFKAWAAKLPAPFERCTYVHMANVALFALILFWKPIPNEVWSASDGIEDALWVVFGVGWLILFAGAYSFGILRLLGIEQMHRWANGKPPAPPHLETRSLYRWLQHPMYIGVLIGLWCTPRMTLGHLMLAGGLTIYLLIGMRFERRDLERRFGARYKLWRSDG